MINLKPYYSTKLGKLYHGDCLEIMPELEPVDLVLADPPFGTTACSWDIIIPFKPMWAQLNRIIKINGAIVLSASQPFTSALISSNVEMFRYCWVWESNNAANFAQAPYMPLKYCEDVAVFSFATIAANSKNRMIYNPQGIISCDKICSGSKANDHRPNRADQKSYSQTKTGYPSQILKFNKPSNRVHPTQKPVELMKYFIQTYTDVGDTVLDFAIGSGTTAVACEELNRKWIGIKLSEKYCEIAAKRLEQETSQLKLF